MTSCPYCSSNVLRHIRHNQIYWFCQHCWQEVPELSEVLADKRWQASSVLATRRTSMPVPQRISVAV